jgi:hypothetical protein
MVQFLLETEPDLGRKSELEKAKRILRKMKDWNWQRNSAAKSVRSRTNSLASAAGKELLGPAIAIPPMPRSGFGISRTASSSG